MRGWCVLIFQVYLQTLAVKRSLLSWLWLNFNSLHSWGWGSGLCEIRYDTQITSSTTFVQDKEVFFRTELCCGVLCFWIEWGDSQGVWGLILQDFLIKVVLVLGRYCLKWFSGLKCQVCPFSHILLSFRAKIQIVSGSDSIAFEADVRFLTDCKISRIKFL